MYCNIFAYYVDSTHNSQHWGRKVYILTPCGYSKTFFIPVRDFFLCWLHMILLGGSFVIDSSFNVVEVWLGSCHTDLYNQISSVETNFHVRLLHYRTMACSDIKCAVALNTKGDISDCILWKAAHTSQLEGLSGARHLAFFLYNVWGEPIWGWATSITNANWILPKDCCLQGAKDILF